MTEEERLRIWLERGRAGLADCTDEGIAALLKLAISGLEKSLQGLPVTGYEHFGFRMTFIRYLRGDDTMRTPKEAMPSLEELRAKRGLYRPTKRRA